MQSKKRLATVLLTISAWSMATLSPNLAYAWGRIGHAIIANIGEANLSPVAREKVAALLALEGAKHLSDVSSWADGPRKDLPESPSHTIRLHFDEPVNPNACHNKFCVVAGIDHYAQVLADERVPPTERLKALKYVVHLVGDVHQPLHCVKSEFSRKPVLFNGREISLGSVWDSGILKALGKGIKGTTKELLQAAPPPYIGGDTMSWAVESRDLARYYIFNDIGGGSDRFVLPPSYPSQKWPYVAQRLTQAGLRLSVILNRALQ